MLDATPISLSDDPRRYESDLLRNFDGEAEPGASQSLGTTPSLSDDGVRLGSRCEMDGARATANLHGLASRLMASKLDGGT